MQWDTYTDTPLNPDVPAAENPPDGAIIDYYLKSPPAGEIKLEVYDSAGKLVRSYSSSGAASLGYKVNVPDYWLAPPPVAAERRGPASLRLGPALSRSRTASLHLLRRARRLLRIHAGRPRHSAQHAVARAARADGGAGAIRDPAHRGRQDSAPPITVKLDPRLHYSPQELQRQLDLSQKIATGMSATYDGYNHVVQLRKELADWTEAQAAAKTLDTKAQALTDEAGPPAGFGPLNRDLTRLMIAVNQSDSPPASELTNAFAGMCQDVNAALVRWRDLIKDDLAALNAQLARQSSPSLAVPKAIEPLTCGK